MTDASASPIKVDIWSDVQCRWCYMGRRTGMPVEQVTRMSALVTGIAASTAQRSCACSLTRPTRQKGEGRRRPGRCLRHPGCAIFPNRRHVRGLGGTGCDDLRYRPRTGKNGTRGYPVTRAVPTPQTIPGRIPLTPVSDPTAAVWVGAFCAIRSALSGQRYQISAIMLVSPLPERIDR